jgi:predicted nucleotidyltransferase
LDVRVFGSVARGEEGEGSDVDVLVDLEAGRSLLDLAVCASSWEICWAAGSRSERA